MTHSTSICTVILGKDSCIPMFHSENDLLANLIVLSPKVARKRFREYIFKDWDWQCAYCDKQLNECTATIDHIVPKHKGGHNTRSNLAASCASCNRAKGSQHVFEYMSPSHQYYSEQRVGKLRTWMEQKTGSLRIAPTAQATPYICHDATLGWIATWFAKAFSWKSFSKRFCFSSYWEIKRRADS